MRGVLQDAGLKAQVTGFELMFHVGFGLDAPARNYRDLLRSDKALYRAKNGGRDQVVAEP